MKAKERYILCHECGSTFHNLKQDDNSCECYGKFTYLDNCSSCDQIHDIAELNEDVICHECEVQSMDIRLYNHESHETPLG